MVTATTAKFIGIPYYLLILLLLCFFNVRIFATVLKHRRLIRAQVQHPVAQQGQNDSAENLRRTKLIGVVVLFNFLSYVPYFLALIIGLFIDNNTSAYNIVESFNGLLTYVNNVVNPVIFGWKDRNIKKYARQVLSRKEHF